MRTKIINLPFYASITFSIIIVALCIAYWIRGNLDIGLLIILAPFLIVLIITSSVISKMMKSFHASVIILIVCAIAWLMALMDGSVFGMMGVGFLLLLSAFLAIVPIVFSIINIVKKSRVVGSFVIILISLFLIFSVLKFCQWLDAGRKHRGELFLNPVFTFITGGEKK